MSASNRSARFPELLQRVREEYQEVPNLRLTPSQATRLFGMQPSECAALLDALVDEHFLTRTADGVFVRSATQ